MTNVSDIQEKLEELLSPGGFEVYPFKIGWYNDKVLKNYILPYEYDTLAFIIISTPDMFENSFKPYLIEQKVEVKVGRDLIDECIQESFQRVHNIFPNEDIEIMHDFELHHSRRPKILVQTAGHVAGAAYYYQRSDLGNDPWEESQKIYGVSVHPKYGGWFALRGVMIFKNVQCGDLIQKEPLNCVDSDKLKQDLLEKYNFHWQDWTFRDVIPVEKKYSEEQKKYFATQPINRQDIINEIRKNGNV